MNVIKNFSAVSHYCVEINQKQGEKNLYRALTISTRLDISQRSPLELPNASSSGKQENYLPSIKAFLKFFFKYNLCIQGGMQFSCSTLSILLQKIQRGIFPAKILGNLLICQKFNRFLNYHIYISAKTLSIKQFYKKTMLSNVFALLYDQRHLHKPFKYLHFTSSAYF